MGWTKRQFINQAFEEIGLAAYVFDLSPEQIISACRRLDSMMAGWTINGIHLGWPAPSTPDSTDLDVDTNVPDLANEAIYLNLARKLAPGFGKTLPQNLAVDANRAYSNLLNQTAYPVPTMQLPGTMPRGAGAKPWRTFSSNQFLNQPVDPLLSGPDGEMIFE